MKMAVQVLDRYWEEENLAVYFTCQSSWAYLHLLFFTHYDPHLLQQDLPERENRLFGCRIPSGPFPYHLRHAANLELRSSGDICCPDDELPDVAPLAVIPNVDGTPLYKIVIRR